MGQKGETSGIGYTDHMVVQVEHIQLLGKKHLRTWEARIGRRTIKFSWFSSAEHRTGLSSQTITTALNLTTGFYSTGVLPLRPANFRSG